MMKRLLIQLAALLMFPWQSYALTTISNSDTFPMSLAGGETYELTENITCADTCFVIRGTGGKLDLKGFTTTFGDGYTAEITNRTFSAWTGSVPDNWTVVSGSVSEGTADRGTLGTSDLTASADFVIRSDAITLTAGKTYQGFAWSRGSSDDSMTVKIIDASDNSVLDSYTYTGAYLSRGFASSGATDNIRYKPTVNTDVKLELAFTGTSSVRVTMADIKPTTQYFAVSNNYQNGTQFPDVSGATWGYITGSWEVTNGTVQQGLGEGVYSAAFNTYSAIGLDINNLTINLTGQNTSGILTNGGSDYSIAYNTIDDNCVYPMVMNRMYGVGAVMMAKGRTGNTNEVSHNTIKDLPQYGIVVSNGSATQAEWDAHAISITHNDIRNKAVATEPYAIANNASSNVEIAYNTIIPSGGGGRGVFSDTTVNVGIEIASGSIHDNTISNIYEMPNFEYAGGSLEAAGIRLRNFSGAAEGTQYDIYDNTISVLTVSGGSHASNGVTINGATANDELEIYNNTIDVDVYDVTTQWGSAISLQGVGNVSATRHIIRNNDITSDEYGIGFDTNDGIDSTNLAIYSNDIDAVHNAIRFGVDIYTGTDSDIDFYCNDLTTTDTTGYPIYLNGTLSDILFDYNNLTTAHSGGYGAWADEDDSTDVLFYPSAPTVDGGGSVGTAGSATNGSDNCWSTAGVIAASGTVLKGSGIGSVINGSGIGIVY